MKKPKKKKLEEHTVEFNIRVKAENQEDAERVAKKLLSNLRHIKVKHTPPEWNIPDMKIALAKAVGTAREHVRYQHSRKWAFTATLRHGLGESRIKDLEKLCKKYNLEYYIYRGGLFRKKLKVSVYPQEE